MTKEFSSKIVEVRLGAKRGEGGTRARTFVIGGENKPPYSGFQGPSPHSPVIAYDVFDMEVPLPTAVRMHVQDVIADPAAMAKLAIDDFGADMVTVHLRTIDPSVKDASPSDAVKTVEKVAQAVDVPLIIAGCGNPKKDAAVFSKIGEAFSGERFLFSSVTTEMDVERCAKVIKKNGHAVLASASTLDIARKLNRRLYQFLPREDIVMNVTTMALGHGLACSFNQTQNSRLAGLAGDPELAHPICARPANAWTAAEAFSRMNREFEPSELRGPLWEIVTGLTLLLAGADLFMMIHPAAVRTMKNAGAHAINVKFTPTADFADWISAKIQTLQGPQ
jgi:acetyl-CoA decarbonylase/synthase complex subunit delta